jgi:ADP-ribose pyrophosphatase YjhB (NUDIX family)
MTPTSATEPTPAPPRTDAEVAAIIAALPRKRVSAGAIIQNAAGDLLLVQPAYHDDGWLLPGGVAEMDESPVDACRREITEELGVPAPRLALAAIDYVPAGPIYSEQLAFVFTASDSVDASAIRLQRSELRAWGFFSEDAALQLCTPGTAPRLQACLSAWRACSGRVLYLEAGSIPDEP